LDGLDLFAPTYSVEGSDEQQIWQPKYTGLHWYWLGNAGGSPIQQDQTFSNFTFYVSSAIPYTLDKSYLVAVGETHNSILYWNMVGGPYQVPELRVANSMDNSIVVSWPAASPGWELQQTDSLSPSAWTRTTNQVNLVSTENQALIGPAIGNQFYRLYRP
jgi:hypothetical protein